MDPKAVISIGKCVGCCKMRRLDEGACAECVSSKNRGPKWLELARRVKSDPEFALECYVRLKDERARVAFVDRYGLPPGAEENVTSLLRPV